MNLNWSFKIILTALLLAQSFATRAQITNVTDPSAYAKFISDRNIFDPNRIPNVPFVRRDPQINRTPQPFNPIESFSLVGVIGYGQGKMAGVYAFFDGTSPNYQITAQLNDVIADFKVTDISADSVTLMSDTNTVTIVKIGDGLHKDGVGHWISNNGMSVQYSSNNRNYGYNNRNFGGRNNGSTRRGRNNNNNGNFGNGGRNFNRTQNNFNGAQMLDNSQMDNQNMDFQGDNPPPDFNAPADNSDMAAPADGAPTQDNAAPPQADTGSPSDTLSRLMAARAAEQQ